MLKLQEGLRALDVICEPGSEDFLAHSALSAAGGATWQLYFGTSSPEQSLDDGRLALSLLNLRLDWLSRCCLTAFHLYGKNLLPAQTSEGPMVPRIPTLDRSTDESC